MARLEMELIHRLQKKQEEQVRQQSASARPCLQQRLQLQRPPWPPAMPSRACFVLRLHVHERGHFRTPENEL